MAMAVWIIATITVIVLGVWLQRTIQRRRELERAIMVQREIEAQQLRADIDVRRKIQQAENDAYRSSESGWLTGWDN